MKHLKLLFSFIAAYLLIACLPVGKNMVVKNSPEEATLLPKDTSIIMGKLANGLTYYIKKNAEPQKRAELRLVVNAGSILEEDKQQGLAHFCEHMAFNGTKHFKKHELVDYLESIGMRFGPELNAYTSFDETVYMLKIPTDSTKTIKTAFTILQDWAQGVNYENEEIDKERGVIKEEWRLGRGAEARMRDKQFPLLFQNSQYAKRMPIGQPEVIDTAHYSTLKQFYKDWYRPDLMAVIAVGDFNVDSIKNLIVQNFSALTMPQKVKTRKSFSVPDNDSTVFAIATDPEATGSRISLYFKKEVQPINTENDYKENLTKNLYYRMLNQRLYELSLDPNTPFLNAFSGEGNFLRTKSFNVLGAICKEKQILNSLKTILIESLKVRKFGFTKSEMERSKARTLRYMEKTYKELDKKKSRAYAGEYVKGFLTQEPITSFETKYELYKKYIPQIKIEKLNILSNNLITDKNITVLLNAPEKEGLSIPTPKQIKKIFKEVKQLDIQPYSDSQKDDPLIANLPQPGTIVSRDSIPQIGVNIVKLSNGISVYYKPTKFKNDQILFTAHSDGGLSLIPDTNYISGMFSSQIINESGLGNFDKIQLYKKLSNKVVRVRSSISDYSESLSGSSSFKDLETMFQLIYLKFTAPKKDSSAFLTVKNRMVNYLKNKDANPQSIFQDTISTYMYNKHFRARPLSIEILQELDLNKVYKIYKERFADASDFTFFFVGNIEKKSFEELLIKYIAPLPKINRKESYKDYGLRNPEIAINKVVKKGKEPKSKVNIQYYGYWKWSPKDLLIMETLSKILNLKLREKLREDKGGTYGVRVWNLGWKYPVQDYKFVFSFGCNPERTKELINIVYEQVDSLKISPVKEIYLNKVKKTYLRKYETDLRENNFWLSEISNCYREKIDYKQILEFEKNVEKITLQDIQQAAQKYFSDKRKAEFILLPEKSEK